MFILLSCTSRCGYVSERDLSSIRSASQRVFALEPTAPFAILRSPLYLFQPPSFAMLFATTMLVVFGARCITFAQLSFSCPALANAMLRCSARPPLPTSMLHG